MGQNKHALQLHTRFNNLHKEHNQRVAEFHKQHTIKIANRENGNGLLARWERFIFFKGRDLIKAVKNIIK
ncbi:hypothetical protein [Bacillus sp. AFS041924]|uniref:hypothetical protein n=1 Tax=Bacillus sp. AFS041924 TaxID=2033503 RepID=UPI000BFC53A8|nr:hypothetical protein [Bacillus sp. AFS041924]PGS50462.1 hypothetical protein COC46_13135 [Bacillus sp. AFS041924]